MENMNKTEFYSYFIPALEKALVSEGNWEQFNVKGPAFFLDVSDSIGNEIEAFIDCAAGADRFLDNVAYYFDAKSHGFDEIDGVKIAVFRSSLEDEILEIKERYSIK